MRSAELQRYDGLSRAFHWLTALAVFGLFGLGFWMVDLDYYHGWYRRAPDLHRSFGLTLALVFVARIAWMTARRPPDAIATHTLLARRLSRLMHVLLLVLLATMFASGYFISTAKGQGIEVFSLFEVPAVFASADNLEDVAGRIHEWTGYALVSLATLHAAAAIKHHFVDRDETLRRMLGLKERSNREQTP